MTLIFNRYRDKEKRKMLRSKMPEAEIILWSKLQKRQQLGYKFHRQYSIFNFVVDFYCPKLKLAIEVDGKSHLAEKAKEYDELRQENIELVNIEFLRFTNEQVYDNLKYVINQIRKKIVSLTPVAPLYQMGHPDSWEAFREGGSPRVAPLGQDGGFKVRKEKK
jgi:very-short-patch-repair endonuclease